MVKKKWYINEMALNWKRLDLVSKELFQQILGGSVREAVIYVLAEFVR